MARVACRSCGMESDDDAGLTSGWRLWCGACAARYFILADASVQAPDDGRDWMEEAPSACLACGGSLHGHGDPPCARCGGRSLRPL